jgi:hypothetical protein
MERTLSILKMIMFITLYVQAFFRYDEKNILNFRMSFLSFYSMVISIIVRQRYLSYFLDQHSVHLQIQTNFVYIQDDLEDTHIQNKIQSEVK